MPIALVLDKVPQSGMHKKLFVVTKPVQFVKGGKVSRLIGVERSWKHDAVWNITGKNFAGHSVAFDAAGGERGRDAKEPKQENGE